MQTFITNFNFIKSAQNLDNKRLGKQRVEAIQIANCLLIEESRWKNHPAVKMWKGYEDILVLDYLNSHLAVWVNRGFKNDKCLQHYAKLYPLAYTKMKNPFAWTNKPEWLTSKFIESHRSNLIRKDRNFYKSLFPDTKENLSYIWPK